MTTRGKLVLAQLPIVVALAATIVVGSLVARALGRASERIMTENYQSVLAAQHMIEAIERVDRGLLIALAGQADRAGAQIDANLPRFERALADELGNLTEPGEAEAAGHLRERWRALRADLVAIRGALAAPELRARYFATLAPALAAVETAADAILELNQDAMWKKSNRAHELAGQLDTLLVVLSIAGLVVGVGLSSVMTRRVLRPLSVLGQTARRLGEGDVAVRAKVGGGDEIGALARELNTMAERIQRYRASSLGELLEAQLAAQATIDSLPDPVLVVSLAGELRHANTAAEVVLAVRTEAGATALATLAPAVRAAVDRLRRHVAGGHGAYVAKGLDEAIELATADGTRLLLPRASPLYADEGDVVGATIVFQDVTRMHRFEELRNDLVATVAHEFRTPLTSLRMAVHLLSEQAVGPLTGKQADLVFAAREECERLQSIVDELLDLSRIQEDRVELRTVEVDPEDVLRDAVEGQRAVADAKQVGLRVEALPGLPAVVVDRERLQLVFANLIGNAVRYGPAGATIVVTAARVPGRDEVRFAVVDRGPGIAEEHQQAIFDKYVRVPGAPAGGAGLGLFIARGIVRAHGGEIGVDSVLGGGATFWFTVKAKPAPVR